jgi:cell division protein ZipA
MDNFRWILLGVGILIIAMIYFISRKNKREFYQDDDDVAEDLPEIKARDWDDLDEGVGKVRIIARAENDVSLDEDDEQDALFSYKTRASSTEPTVVDEPMPVVDEQAPVSEPTLTQQPEARTQVDDEALTTEAGRGAAAKTDEEPAETVLILNLLARRGGTLSGDSINSVARANDLVFGDMNIYHRLDDNNTPIFSMINMVKPGSFDPSTLHELKTPGVSLFLQLPGPAKASDAFNDMLQTAQRMSETLDTRLCDQRRKVLTESVVEQYRQTAAAFDGKG